MLRTTLLLLFLVLLAPPARGELRVVASTTDLASIARMVGGDRVEVDHVCEGDEDPHYVELLPSHMLRLRRADVFLVVGMDLDIWAGALVGGARNRDLDVVDCSQGIEPLEVPVGRVDPSQGDIHAYGNPHYWLDPANGAIIARTIEEALVAADPAGAAHYAAGRERFEAALATRIDAWRERYAQLDGTEIVFFHNSWPYFCRAFGLEPVAFIEPKPGVGPSPSHLAQVVATMREAGAKLVAVEPFYNPRTSRRVAEEAGGHAVVLATSVGGIEGADDYFGLFEANLSRLAGALAETRP